MATVIRPRTSAFANVSADLTELIAYRHLLRRMFIRDWNIRYRSSRSAVLFSIIAPLVQVLVMTVAVGFILNSGPRNLSAYILCGTIPFGFFQASIMASFTGIDAMQPLIKRIYFPREVFVISYVTINFVQMLISLAVFLFYRYVILAAILGWPGWPPVEILWLPSLMLLTYILTLGIAFIASAAFFYFEDVRFIVNFMLSMLFYLVPILYFAENIYYTDKISSPWLRSAVYHVYLANPIAWIVTAFKEIFFGQQIISPKGHQILLSAPLDYRYFCITTLTSVCTLIGGYLFFNHMKWKFAERP